MAKKILPRAIVFFLINLVIPGLGSLAAKKTRVGMAQLSLTILAAIFVYLGMPNGVIGAAAVSAWLWALMTSSELLQQEQNSKRPR